MMGFRNSTIRRMRSAGVTDWSALRIARRAAAIAA